jgi:hypothetical protein
MYAWRATCGHARFSFFLFSASLFSFLLLQREPANAAKERKRKDKMAAGSGKVAGVSKLLKGREAMA